VPGTEVNKIYRSEFQEDRIIFLDRQPVSRMLIQRTEDTIYYYYAISRNSDFGESKPV